MLNNAGKSNLILVCTILFVIIVWAGYTLVKNVRTRHEQAEQSRQRELVLKQLESQQRSQQAQAQGQAFQIEQAQMRALQAKKTPDKSVNTQ